MKFFLIRPLFACLVSLVCLVSPIAHADGYLQREDVQSFLDDMVTTYAFDRTALYAAFHAAKPQAGALRAIRPPAEPRARSWQAYRARFVEPRRIAAGKAFMRQYADALAAAQARFGVPEEIIAAILGVETIYGKHMGDYPVFDVLVTLAFDYPPRAELFRRELTELLLLAREEQRPLTSYVGSYAGAIGWPQFLPSSYRKYAIDFDDDGKIDLANDPVDAIGSAANFLAAHGWVANAPIAEPVVIRGDGLDALLAAGISPQFRPADFVARDVQVWKKVGPGETAEDATLPDLPAAVIDLTTPDAATEYRLGYANFYVITRYNRSSFYAAAVMDLAAALRE
jgi:membrane-bound lytic murein transglycosylase B